MNDVEIFGIYINRISYADLLDKISVQVKKNNKLWIATPNPEILLKANSNPQFHQILNSATFKISDGVGLSVAAYFLQLKQNQPRISRFWVGRLLLWKYSL